MTCKGCQDRDKRIRLLNLQISILQESNRNLSRKLNELLKHDTMLAGLKGEKLILDIAKGTSTKRGTPYDIKLHNGLKVEVKYSRVTEPVHGSTCRRWVWNGVIGEKHAKDYDILVLIGEKDGEYHKFEDDNSNFVYFILKKDDIRKMVVPGGKRGWIALNLNPNTTRSPFSKFLWKYKMAANKAIDFFNQLIVEQKNEILT